MTAPHCGYSLLLRDLAKATTRRGCRWQLQRDMASAATTGVPDSADVVVIGGGSAGCNALYQLARRGVKAVLLERSKLTAGTTWHTSGLVWRLRPNDVEIQLLATTRSLLVALQGETGMDPGWINNGGLYIANNAERLKEYQRLVTAGHSFGIESSILGPEEVKARFPLIDCDVICGGLYSPGDGVLDSNMLCTALTRSATRAGCQVIENCPVENILTGKNGFGSKQVTGVSTPYGVIKTKCVLNCAGVWSRELVALAGLHLPLVPMKHAYVVTETIPGVKGLPNIRDHDGSVYFRVQGEALHMGGYENNPIILDKVSSSFEFDLYDLDWAVFATHMREAIKLMPVFETAGIKSTVCGPESFTPDHKPIMGEDPRLLGLYHSCGYNSAGMMLGGGCGEQIAQWIVHGRPDLHMFNYDIRRFMPEQTRDKAWVTERSHESYAKNYSIVFPHDEPLAGRNKRKDPFHEELLARGCFFEERQGWERPGWFTTGGPAPVPPYDWYGAYGTPHNNGSSYVRHLTADYTFGFPQNHSIIGEECLACREQVALFDMSYFCKLYLSGPEAQQAADWLFTANTRRPFGRTVYTCILNSRAGVEGDVTVSVIKTGNGGLVDPIFKGRGFYIVAGGASAAHTWAHIHSVLSHKDFNVNLTDLTDKMGILSLQGPNSRALLQSLTNTDLGDGSFPYGSTRLLEVAGRLCRALRVSFVGELGWELHVPLDACAAVYSAVVQEGSRHGLRHAGFRALYSLSNEAGTHLWHADLRSDDNPLEASLQFTCRADGDYLGRRALDAARRQGVKKRLAYLQLREQVPVWGLETIRRDGEVVGHLRRGEYAYSLGASLGRGYIRHPEGRTVSDDFLQNGRYEVEIMGKNYDATLLLNTSFDPQKKRIRGIYDEPLPVRK
ncbi:sarcosine dehydrogenase, mitochondrial [Bacillus rossius redtenbacheri]|uniref:sarcosine dehydrogenase, mitochondrial n=1 Tax=Bacillus rossius redtenbacheri TaxID=93214 RepID=UPI002FDDCD71